MAIAFRAIGATSKVQSGNLSSVALPSGHVTNDILVLCTIQQDNVASTVAGYTQIGTVSNTANLRIMFFAKRDGGSESAPTVTHAAGGITNAAIMAFSGVDSGLTIGVGAGAVFRDSQSQNGTSQVTFTAPALTGVVANDFRVFFGGFTVNDTSGATTNNWGTVSTFTERLDDCSDLAGAWGVSLGIDTLLAAGSAGSITSAVGWVGGFTSWNWTCFQFAFSSDSSAAGLPAGQASFDTRTPLRTLFAPERSQDLGYVDGTEIWLLKGQDVQFGARGQWKTYDWPNPTLKNPNLELRWWFERYKLMLIGRDVLPAVMDDQPNPTLKRDDINHRTFTDWYNLMLIGKDVLPFTRHDQPNPTLKHDDVNQRTHWWNPLQTLLTFIVQNPFALLSWPNPLGRRPAHQDTQGWYVLSLIGRDAMPFGQTGWPNPRIAARAVDLLTHIWNPLYQLLAVLAAPFAFFDWVVPRRPRTMQDHSESYPLTLIGQDALPFDLTEWPNPQQPKRSIDLLTQAASGFWNLLTVIIQAPFAMLNWPNPLGRRHAHQGTTDSYKLTLIGKDALPFRVTEWPNPLPKRWGISLRGLVDGLRRWLPIPAPSQLPGRLAPSDARVGTLSMADLSAHITVIEVAIGRTTVTDAEAPIGPSDMPAGTIKVTDRLLN